MTTLAEKPVASRTGLVTVPAGRFSIGENDGDKFANDTERPRHEVTIARPFSLAAFPVTVAEFREFRPGHPDRGEDAWPTVRVSWHDAVAYCEWLGPGFRLPTEAEWEYAARAGSDTPFPTGQTLEISDANFLYDEHGFRVGLGRRTPAGAFPRNAFALESMNGNVCEWCADTWHPNYEGAPSDGSAWIGGNDSLRVIRGGAWDYLPRLLRSSWRDALPASTRRDNVGFRVARDLP